jgi:DNA-binding NtrC family response regulator
MDAILEACQEVGIIGTHFRDEIAAQVQSAVVARKGRDVVRITGETGTGKEMVASLVHRVARQHLGRGGELVEFNCGNLPETLFESSLFGHKRGSFTGAADDRVGLLDRARGGTIVLDEVQNLSRDAQGKLLRLIGEREYRPVGSPELKRTDALVVLISNVDLVQLSATGNFRRDLVDRAPAKINLLPLWQRREDISELGQSFAMEAGHDRGWADFEGFTRRALADLEGAVVEAQEASVRRLRELVRDSVFAAPEGPLDRLESNALAPFLTQLGVVLDRAAWDRQDVEDRFDLAVEAAVVREIAQMHGVPETTLLKLARVLREIRGSFDADGKNLPGSYRNLMARTAVATKAALWLLSGAKNQGEFRRFFGDKAHEMPPKSVAWQIYHDVFGDAPAGKKDELS